MRRRLKHWGWGYEDEQPSPAELQQTAAFLAEHLGFGEPQPEPPAPPPALPATRLRAPGRLAAICSVHDRDRARHSLGSSYRDVVRGFRGRFEHVTDVVARPREETEVDEVLDWAIGAGAAVIPYGGGTSVVGGVEPDVGVRYNGVVTLDLRALDRVLEVDPVSRGGRSRLTRGPDPDMEPWMTVALAICGQHGGSGERRGQAGPGGSAGPADSWRQAFLRAPYLRETFVAMGIISETFETAITWERFPSSTAR